MANAHGAFNATLGDGGGALLTDIFGPNLTLRRKLTATSLPTLKLEILNYS